jgi:hypothetical protein
MMEGLERHTAMLGPGWTQEVVRLVPVDGHQVAWVSFHLESPDGAQSGAHLLCDCDMDEARAEQEAVIGVQGWDPSRCRYRLAAQLLRCLEIRDEIVDPRDWRGQRLPGKLVEIVHRGYAGEWVGQSSTDAMWLSEVEAVFDLPAHALRETAYALMQQHQLGLTGMVVAPWSRRFLPRDDRDQHLSDNEPPEAAPVTGTLELFTETGTEGGHWAVQRNDTAGYPGLHMLRTGDWLEILDIDETVTWQGYVRLRHYPPLTEAACGMWIHADQRGVDRESWAAWFRNGRRARLIPAAAARGSGR